MARTQVGGQAIQDGSLQRKDMDITTTGQAMITKVAVGSNMKITSSTGADAGTGDVTIEVGDAVAAHIISTHAPADAQKNSNILQSEIEAKLVGEISTHSHADISAPGIQLLDSNDDIDWSSTARLDPYTYKVIHIDLDVQSRSLSLNNLGNGGWVYIYAHDINGNNYALNLDATCQGDNPSHTINGIPSIDVPLNGWVQLVCVDGTAYKIIASSDTSEIPNSGVLSVENYDFLVGSVNGYMDLTDMDIELGRLDTNKLYIVDMGMLSANRVFTFNKDGVPGLIWKFLIRNSNDMYSLSFTDVDGTTSFSWTGMTMGGMTVLEFPLDPDIGSLQDATFIQVITTDGNTRVVIQGYLEYLQGMLAWDKIDKTGATLWSIQPQTASAGMVLAVNATNNGYTTVSLNKNIDGGSPDSVYLATQVIDGGNP